MYIKIIFLCFIFKSICGDDVAQRLTNRYNDVRSVCTDQRNKIKPAYECSGLMMRGVGNVGTGIQKFAWSKKESNIRRNAFSVTFLRRDQRFNRVAKGYESGFIYYPHSKIPRGKNKYPVYCAFPVDGWTDFRLGSHGCGQYYNDRTGKSGHCEAQGITSLSAWTSHLDEVISERGSSNDFPKYQCFFDMTTKDAAQHFSIILEGKEHIRRNNNYGKLTMYHNELVIRAWNEDHPDKLPIEAFFYIKGFSKAREDAFMYQRDYLGLTGKKIPVVSIRLPQPNDPDIIVENQ